MSASPLTVVVTGPTCGGKTGRATELARHFRWPILSLDSMKVYRGMDIGTAKPSPDLRTELRFELLDLREPWESFSVADYLAAWTEVTAAISGPTLLSGGTVFYLNALREGLFAGPGADLEIRERLTAEAKTHGVETLHRRLREVDPVAAAKIHPADLRRIIRALEVEESSGEPISVWHARRRPLLDPARTLYVGVYRPRQELFERIDRRVERMFDGGWVSEVETLLGAHDPPWGAEASQSIGYVRIAEAIGEARDPREEIETIQNRTRGFARSQLTWVRKLPVEWWREDESAALIARVEAIAASDASVEPDPERTARKTEV